MGTDSNHEVATTLPRASRRQFFSTAGRAAAGVAAVSAGVLGRDALSAGPSVAHAASSIGAVGQQVSYAEITSVWYSSSATMTEIPGLSLAVDIIDRPILLEVEALLQVGGGKPGSNVGVLLIVKEGTTEVLRVPLAMPGMSIIPVQKARLLVPTPGEHVYSVHAAVTTAGAAAAVLAYPTAPAYLRAVQA